MANSNLRVHEHLHREKARRKERERKKVELAEELGKFKTEQEKISLNSKILSRKLVIRRLATLFQDLDSQKSGVLSAQNLNLKAFSGKQANVFAELLTKLQTTKASLRLEEFVDKALEIWEKLEFDKKLGVLDRQQPKPLLEAQNLAIARATPDQRENGKSGPKANSMSQSKRITRDFSKGSLGKKVASNFYSNGRDEFLSGQLSTKSKRINLRF